MRPSERMKFDFGSGVEHERCNGERIGELTFKRKQTIHAPNNLIPSNSFRNGTDDSVVGSQTFDFHISTDGRFHCVNILSINKICTKFTHQLNDKETAVN